MTLCPAAAALLVAVAAVAAAGCGGSDASQAVSAGGGWTHIASTLEPGLDPDSENVCARGDPACVEAVLAEMDERLWKLGAACDHDAAFLLMYREVTAAVAGSERFTAPAGLNHLDAVFAALYFDAVDAWQAGADADVPRAWRIAFAAARDRRVSGVGDMLLGMNAHISRDLPFALAAVWQGKAPSGKADFDRVNELLTDVQEPMLAEVARRLDPTVDDFTLPALDVDENGVGRLIAAWRAEAWLNAERIARAETPAERRAAEALVESQAAVRALAIRTATGYIPFLTSTRPRDAWCAEHG